MPSQLTRSYVLHFYPEIDKKTCTKLLLRMNELVTVNNVSPPEVECSILRNRKRIEKYTCITSDGKHVKKIVAYMISSKLGTAVQGMLDLFALHRHRVGFKKICKKRPLTNCSLHRVGGLLMIEAPEPVNVPSSKHCDLCPTS